jgi:hypothetical protein
VKDSNEVESRNSNAIANQPAQLQSKGAALAAPSQARSNLSPPSTNQEVVQKQLDLDAELLVLGGQLSFGAKFKGLFGSETSFSKIEKLVKEYSVKKSPATKQAIIAECNAWLTSDSRKSVKDGDDIKKASITRIRNGLKNDEAGAIDLTILSDKVTTTNKIKEAITGEKSTYQKLEQSYLEYQQKLTSYEFTAENVKIIVEAVREVDTLVDLWKTKHTEELGSEKGKEVINIQNNIGKLSMAIKLSDYLSLSIKGIKLSSIKNGIFEAELGEADLNVLGNNIKATVTKPIITDKSANWDTATFSLSELKIGTVSMFDLGGSIKGKSQNYEYTLSAKAFNASIADKLNVSGKEIAFDSAAEKLTASEAEAKIAFFNTEVTGTVTNLNASITGGLDWEKASIATGEINVMSANIKELTGEIGGKAEEYTYTISATSFDANVDNLVNVSGNKISYNSAKKELEADSAKVALTVLDETVSGEVVGPKVNKEGIDWETASITLPDIELGSVNIEGLTGTIGGKAAGFAYTISSNKFNGEVAGITYSGSEVVYDSKTGELSAESAGAEFSLFDKTIKGEINKPVISKEGVNWESASISVDSLSFGGFVATGLSGELGNKSTEYEYKLSAESFTGELVGLSISGTEIAYDSKSSEFSAKSASASIKLFANDVTGTINDLVSSQENGFDWSSAELKADPGEIGFGDNLSFSLPKLILNGKAKNYKVEINEAKGQLIIGESIKASGEGDFSWEFMKGETPEITRAKFRIEAKTGEFPGEYTPMWPFEIIFPFPVAPGVDVSFGFGAGGGISLAFDGEVDYESDKLTFKLEGGPEGTLALNIFISVGIGNPLLVSLEAALIASAVAKAKALISLSGTASKKDNTFNFEELAANYNLSAEFIAELKIALRARALYFFSKTLYEVEIAKWELGKSEKEGKFNLFSEVNGGDSLKDGFIQKPKNPFTPKKSKYLQNLEIFNNEIESSPNTESEIQKTKSFMDTDRAVSEEEIKAKFEQAKAIIIATPDELLKRKTVLDALILRKKDQWSYFQIRPENKKKRLDEYDAISTRISDLKAELDSIQNAINTGLEPGLTNDIAPLIKQLFKNLGDMTIAFDHADKYNTLENTEKK